MTDIILDLETFGLAPTSAVVAIGAVNVQTDAEFYGVIENPTGTIDAGTVRWWLQQREEVRAAVVSEIALPHDTVLALFGAWLSEQRTEDEPLRLWGSEDFDTMILRNAYASSRLKLPWHYQEPRGLRTAFDLLGVDEDAFPWEDRIEHVAIDCARQAAAILRSVL